MASVSESRSLDLPAQKIREQLARILRTPDFADYPRSAALLSYVIEETLAGRGAGLKEATIGIEVFGREPGYDCKADSVVRTQARRVREKLGQYYSLAGPDDGVRIEIPKGGYVPEFQIIQNESAPARKIRVQRLALGLVALAVVLAVVVAGLAMAWRRTPRAIPLPAIAVLPFADPSHKFDTLSFGLREDLERDLARASGLRIHATPQADQLTEAERSDYAALSRKLGVEALLDGQIISNEIQVSLIHASDASILWTDRFRADEPIGAVERQIEENVANALHLKLPATVPARTENPKAHDLYFAGRTLWATRIPEKTREAIKLYEQALKLDPNYALAYMGIADAYALMGSNSQIDTQIALDHGLPAVRRALELDPSMAEAHAALGLLDCLQGKVNECDAEYQRAIELNPSYDRAYAREGTLQFGLGDFAGAERYIRESETLNPYAMSLPLIRAELYYFWRRYRESEDLIRVVLNAEPKNPTAFQLLARNYLQQHQPQRAVAAQRTAVAQVPDSLIYQAGLAGYLYQAGNTAEAKQWFDKVLHPGTADAIDPYSLAATYLLMGDKAKALDYLEKALAAHTAELSSIRWEPVFDPVHDEPRYKAIVEKLIGRK